MNETPTLGRVLLNKVPEVTIFFWLIKVMCTTVGETAADFLNVNLNFGLTGTSIVTGLLLAVALVFQFRAKKYIPVIYWIAVALVSVFGTLVTDNLTDAVGVPLEVSTVVFSVLLAATFAIWYSFEKTLSIHSIFTTRREMFYWLAILCTFALGTASGDLMAEGLGLGYATTGLIIAGLIFVFAIGWKFWLNPVLSFWLIYILTRPLGASIGDYLSQSPAHGGLGLGATVTSYIFVAGILLMVAYLSFAKTDTIGSGYEKEVAEDEHTGGLWQTVSVVAILVVAGLIGYHFQHAALQAQEAQLPSSATSTPSTNTSPLGDLSSFQTTTQAMLDSIHSGDWSGANSHANDLEYEWDTAEARLKSRDTAKWTEIDGAIDKVLREVRAVTPNTQTATQALETLLGILRNP